MQNVRSKSRGFSRKTFIFINKQKNRCWGFRRPRFISIAALPSGAKRKTAIFHYRCPCDHMFRGEESYQDALFVKDYCEQHQSHLKWNKLMFRNNEGNWKKCRSGGKGCTIWIF